MDLKIFSGSSHPALAREICARLGLPLGKSRISHFSNENIKVHIDENVRGADVFVVQTAAPPLSENLIELVIFIDALRQASADRITVVAPYYPYVRSDKKDEPRISITARLMADLWQTAGADRALLMDLHAPQVQGFFRIPCDQLTAVPLLCDALQSQCPPGETVVVAPDVGATKRAMHYARRLQTDVAVIEKRRTSDDENARAVRLVGDVRGKHAVIIDDEVSTGGTLVEAAEFVLREGAQAARAAIIHGVLCGPAVERVRGARIAELIVSDTVPVPEEKRAGGKVRVVGVAPLLADAIQRIHDGASVSALFD
jgi:ribose-phosphate pyrophosphokinase